jgi:hypothetical protein
MSIDAWQAFLMILKQWRCQPSMFLLCLGSLLCLSGRGSRPVPRQVTADGVLYGKRTKDLSQLLNDDELAAEEAAAQGGIPGECSCRPSMYS